MKQAKGFLKDLFYFEGANKTTPDCPVKIVADYDPTNGELSWMISFHLPLCRFEETIKVPQPAHDVDSTLKQRLSNFRTLYRSTLKQRFKRRRVPAGSPCK